MCASMADIHSAMAEIRQGKKGRKKNKRQDENIMVTIKTACRVVLAAHACEILSRRNHSRWWNGIFRPFGCMSYYIQR